MKKRIIAVAAMLVIAVVANGIRIFGIIGLAEFTHRKIDIVDDHLLYGWGFFAIILLVAGWVGSKYADPVAEKGPAQKPEGPAFGFQPGMLLGLLTLFAVGLLPLYRGLAVSSATGMTGARLEVASIGGAAREISGDVEGQWAPHFDTADREVHGRITLDGISADYFAALYDYQSDDRELITYRNDPTDNVSYRRRGGFGRTIEVGGKSTPWRFVRVRSASDSRLVAYSYYIDGRFVVSNLAAKLYQAKATLLWGRPDAGVVAFSVPMSEGGDQAEEALTQLISQLDLDQLFQPADGS